MQQEPFFFRGAGRVLGVRRHGTDAPADDTTLAAVNRFALRPLTREDIAIFTLDLCHNQVDKHFSRFPEEELEKIAAMVPGRPLMERHDLRGALPRGTFFRARVHREGDRLSVRPEVYVLRTAANEDFIRSIEGGVYRETSIGFSFARPECSVCGADIRGCPHTPGEQYDGAVCHYLLREVLEVIEGSVVAAGSQGTHFVGPGAVRAGDMPALPAWGWPGKRADALAPAWTWSDE